MGPKEVLGLVLQPVLGTIQIVTTLIREDRRLSGELKHGLDSIRRDLDWIRQHLEMIQASIEEYDELQLQELAYDIEDFVYLLCKPGPFGGFILNALGTDPRPDQLRHITSFKERIKSLSKKISQQKSSESSQSGAGTKGDRAPKYTPEVDLVGISEPKRELLELLTAADGWQPKQLRVISIVGPRGVGKTALARAVHDAKKISGGGPGGGLASSTVHILKSVPKLIGRYFNPFPHTTLNSPGEFPSVHDGPVVADKFDCVAWVVAPECNHAESECNHAEDLINMIHQDVARTAGPGDTSSGNLHNILKDKRYLVFIDDLQRTKLWEDIKHAFPRNDKGSRIIVTTSVHSVAKACSSRTGRYDVYAMGGLGEADSKQLFWTKVNGYQTESAPTPALDDGSKSIFIKCGGLPLALITAADYLRAEKELHDLRKAHCERVGDSLFNATNTIAFGKMKTALVQCYDSLPDYGHKTCLLSLSIFPRGHQINSKSLIRRLLAEGLIKGDVSNCLDNLIDRSIIEKVQIHNNCKVVERCQVHRIMLELTIHKSVSKNFVTLIHGNKPQHNTNCTVRRLTVQSSTKVGCDEFVNGPAIEKGLSAVRSLTIFNSELPDFKKCKLLRVLDLEGCNGLEKVLDDKCEFRFLKYLSLRGSDLPKIPKIIGRLYNLETLDLRERWVETLDNRETRVDILPMEVIKLPKLVYLFGQFDFELPPETEELKTFLSNKSELHTLAGFVINKTQGFENIILHARKLRKVKVWCKDTATPAPAPAPRSIRSIKRKLGSLGNSMKRLGPPESIPSTMDPPQRNGGHDFSEQNVAITIFVSSLVKRFTDLESLSINSSGLSKAFLSSLEAPCAIKSIKLSGKLESLPDSTTLGQLRNLNELHLLSTGLRSEDLSVLQSLPCLEYLKLAEDGNEFGDGSLVVERQSDQEQRQSGGFPSLQRLWFELPKLPRVQIEQGAMTNLTSLHLLCREFADGLGVTGLIVHLESLDEVVLHPSVSDSYFEAWKGAANQHQNRPHVKKQPTA